MSNRLLTWCLVAGLALFLASCGGDRGQKQPGSDASLEGQKARSIEEVDPTGQTITFWYQHTREREETLQGFIREFNAANPYKIKVVGEYAGGYDDIYKKMIVGIQSGSVPHLVVAYQNQAAAYALGGGLVDLEPYLTSPRWGFSEADRADFFPAFLRQDLCPYVNNQRLGFPPNRSMEVIYYNADWLKELGFNSPPANWDQFRQMACLAARKPFSKATHPKASLGFEFSVDASRFASMVFSRGGDLVNQDGSAYSLNGPAVRETMVYLKGLFDSGCARLAAEPYTDQADFAAGDLLFTMGSTSGLPFYQRAVEEGVGFQWRIAAVPHTTPDPVQNIYGASLSISKTTPAQQLAAWVFLKWMTLPAQQAQWARSSNYFPVRRSTADELTAYFAENPNYELAFRLLGYSKSEPSVAGYDLVRDMIDQAVAAVADGADVDKTLADLQKKAADTLASLLRDAVR